MKLKKYLIGVPIALALTSISQVSHANDYGCTVLLCLSDVRGPRTEAECRPSIDRLFRDLKKGRGFPSCAIAGNPLTGEGSFARTTYNPFDECPAGLTPVSGYVAQGNKDSISSGGRFPNFGNNLKHQYSDSRFRGSYDSPAVGPRACVGNNVGKYTFYKGSGENRVKHTVLVYDEIVWQQRKNPQAIDIFIDGVFHQRVRY